MEIINHADYIANEKYYIDDETLNLIAEKPFTNIREMEGILSKVWFYASLTCKKCATMEDVKEALKSLGYSNQELKKIDKFLLENKDLPIEVLIKESLKNVVNFNRI